MPKGWALVVSRSHPGVSVVPAALAAGEQYGVSGTHFLRAVTLGYDVGTRVTMSMGGPAYQAATHRSTHGTVAVFAAGAAAGCAASLTAEQMRLLLDYSAQQTSGIGAWSRDAEHMEKAFLFGGKPAAGAVTVVTGAQTAPAKTLWDGLYTDEQASRGNAVFNATCENCHTLDSQGNPAVGPEFLVPDSQGAQPTLKAPVDLGAAVQDMPLVALERLIWRHVAAGGLEAIWLRRAA